MNDENWRVSEIDFLKQCINDLTQRKVLLEVDLASIDRLGLIIQTQAVDEELKRNKILKTDQYKMIVETIKSAEQLLKEHEKSTGPQN